MPNPDWKTDNHDMQPNLASRPTMKPPTRPSNRGNAMRYAAAALLVLLSLYLAYGIWAQSGSANMHGVAFISTCPKQPNSSLHRLYVKDPTLSVNIFTFNHDAISKEVADHSQREFHLGHRMVHQFYANTLCSHSFRLPALGRRKCQGLVLDVGAFIGTHALVLARLGFSVHAFEPQSHAVELIRCSATANQLNVTAVAEGVSDTVGKECFINPMVAAMHQAMVAPKLLTKLGCDDSSKVQVVTLDHYWKNVLNQEQVLFIKVDAEGHESFILGGASQLMATSPPPFMLVEYFPHMLTLKNVTPSTLLEQMYGYGYRVYDCTKKLEILKGPKGEALLKPYAMSFSLTDLLLVHSSHAPQGDLSGKYDCAY